MSKESGVSPETKINQYWIAWHPEYGYLPTLYTTKEELVRSYESIDRARVEIREVSLDEVKDSYKDTWIKAKDRKPNPKDLVVIRAPTTHYDEDLNPNVGWEYNAGPVLITTTGKLFLSVAHDEYNEVIDEDTEWKPI